MTNRRLPLIAVAIALFATGCGSSAKDEKGASQPAATQTTAPAQTTAPTATATAAPAGKPVTVKNLAPISTNLKQEPIVKTPTGTPPSKLLVKDVVKGTGSAAKAGDTLSVEYTGYSLSTGQKFDASWDRGAQPFKFQLGAQQVIPGWDEGLVGMHVGGRRELVIPPNLAYGAQGQPPSIAPDDTLIFIVDLRKIG